MAARNRILMIDDEAGMCAMVAAVLSDAGFEVVTRTDALMALSEFRPGVFGVVITDVKMPGIDGLEVLARVRQIDPKAVVVVITAHATVDNSIEALRRGAFDMLTKPFEPDELIHRVENAFRQRQLEAENLELKAKVALNEAVNGLVGQSAALRKVVDMAEKVAARDFPVLIMGESGTGKELFARMIHQGSTRRQGPFVAINCGALPKTLLESELFGARKGAFTGADSERAGLVQEAHGGTLFLDEVGNLPEQVQKVLLRFLQEKEFYRIGDTVPTRVDVRVVAATNSDLELDVAEGRFREDLYYRLAVARLKLPPLRERTGDLVPLANHFIAEQNRRFPGPVTGLAPEAAEALRAYSWPGNVRQLKNVIEAAMAIESSDRLGLEAITQFIRFETEGGSDPDAGGGWARNLERFETTYFRKLLEDHGGRVEEAALSAGVNLATFYRKIKKYGLRTK